MSDLIAGRYSAMHRLGLGGFGDVYLACDQESGQHVAIKFLVKATQDALGRFEREARLLHAHDSCHIVKLLDCRLDAVPPFLVMEYCEHGSLRSWVGRKLAWENVVAALSHAIIGLGELHRRGGFHRDIKPDNLLIAQHPSEKGKVIIKLGDLGLARTQTATGGPLTRTAAGTPGYIAPEVLDGAPYTSSADIFSLGLVGVELLTGVASREALKPASGPHELCDLLKAMLAREPSRRPTAVAVAGGLASLLASAGGNANVKAQKANQEASEGAGGVILRGLFVAGVIAAVIALASGGNE